MNIVVDNDIGYDMYVNVVEIAYKLILIPSL